MGFLLAQAFFAQGQSGSRLKFRLKALENIALNVLQTYLCARFFAAAGTLDCFRVWCPASGSNLRDRQRCSTVFERFETALNTT
jgi:hypothetical protein